MSLNVGTLSAVLDLDANPFEKKLLGTSTTAEKAGKKMTTSLTLPLAAVGVAGVKMSLDFEKIFSRMQGLAGVSADEVDGLKQSVMDLAAETGKGPQELAEALYFVRSAGLDGQAAMDALEMSAKGAAAGLGETAAVADAVTSAMNGYGAEVLSAADATDVLVATAREGKAEASELAPQFGRLIPVAAELGITFDQVGAGMAFLSRASGDASLSATQLDGVMQKLIKPSQQGAQALEDVGLSTDAIRKSIKDQGLLPTLEMLRDRLGDSGFVKFFDDVQGLQGALQLTGTQADEAKAVFDALADSAGATDDAFAKWAETAGFKNSKAFAEMQTALIKLGDTLVPLAAKAASFASALAEWFANLDDGSRAMIITFGIFVAAIGPAITVGSNLVKAIKAIGVAYQWAQVQAGLFATGGLSAMSLGAPAAIAALVAVGAAVNKYGSEVRNAKRDSDEWAQGFAGDFDPAKASMSELQAEIGRLNGAADEMQHHANNAINPFLDDRLKNARDNLRETAAPLQEIADKAKELQTKLGISADEALRMATNQGFMAEATDNATGVIDEEAAATALATQQLQAYSDALTAMFDPLFGAQTAMLRLKDAQQAVNDAVAANSDANADNNVTQEEMIRLNAAAVQAAVDYQGALLTLKQAVETGDVKMSDAIATLQAWAEQGLITKEQADEASWSFGVLGGKADELDGKNVVIHAEADTSTAEGRIQALKDSIASVPRTVPVNFIGPLLPNQRRAKDPDARAGGGPVWAGEDFLVGEEGPELVRFSGAGHVFDADTTRQMLSGGGSTAPAMPAAAPTIVDQSQHTFAPQITTGLDPAETFAALDRYTRMRYGRSLASVVGA